MKKNSFIIRKNFKLSKTQLFECWSNPRLLEKWLINDPNPSGKTTVESSFTVGGNYRIISHFNMGDYIHQGKYLEINRYNLIKFTWNTPTVKDTVVTVKFKEISTNTTELTLEHSLFPDDLIASKHNDGWSQCLKNLDSFIFKSNQQGLKENL